MKKLSRVAVVLLLVAIILVQLGVRVWAGTQKEYLHMDEAYSYGLMNYRQTSIADAGDLLGQWHKPDYFLDYLSISRSEASDWSPVFVNQLNDVHPPLFYLLLRLFASTTIGGFSMWTGLALNMAIWVGSAILVFLITRRLVRDDRVALVATFLAGLTLAALDMSLYIRMYELGAFNILLLTLAALRLLQKPAWRWFDLALLSLALVIGALTHYHFFFFAIGVIGVLLYKLIKKKTALRKIELLLLAAVIAGVVSLSLWPAILAQLISSDRGAAAIQFSWSHLGTNLALYAYIVATQIIGWLGMGLLLIGLVWMWLIRPKRGLKLAAELWLLLIPAGIFAVCVVATTQFQELRYLMPICPILMIGLVVAVHRQLQKRFPAAQVILILAIASLVLVLTPVISRQSPELAYAKYNHIVQKVDDFQAPMLYVFNPDINRLLDDIYLLTRADSLVVDVRKIDSLPALLQTKNVTSGLVVIINFGSNNDLILGKVKSASGLTTSRWMQRLNVADVYFLR